MRLLQYNDGDLSLTTFFADKIPQKYAILSHTWGAEEICKKKTYGKKAGYNKIRFCGEQARRDGLQYFWVDTCCIDKSSSAELTEAINSMFRWYRESTKCYVYLSDVSTKKRKEIDCLSKYTWEPAFRSSRWFTRGWTLQELLAPESVEFFSEEGKLLGDKSTLEGHICEIARVPAKALRGSTLSDFSITSRMSWAERRETTREEDQAYSLLGIFDVYMPLIYGEGKEHAFKRLREAINVYSRGLDSMLQSLPCAVDASFNSYAKQDLSVCLPNTRVGLLKEIYNWVDSEDERCIFWLNGLAGTGKSTIARTVARRYYAQKRLGASFFFSRGGGDVGHASKFFTSIAVQLAYNAPSLRRYISEAAEEQIDIVNHSLRDQWHQLVLRPLSKLDKRLSPSSYLLIIDAIDECANEDHIRTILQLLAEARSLTTVRLRVFLTSRPEIPIRHGIRAIPQAEHQDFVLHNIQQTIVNHDISLFLEYNLGTIGQDYSLGANWPGEVVLRQLVLYACGLFIWAATACRFIREGRRFARKRLDTILKGSSSAITEPEKHLNEIYLAVLKHSISSGYLEEEKEEACDMLKHTLGSIVVLLSPLSVSSLSGLLHLPKEEVDQTFEDLYAILDIPEDPTSPLRLHHPSFRDFLLSKDRCGDFWVDEKQAHRTLAASCIRLMSQTLKRDICERHAPESQTKQIESSRVQKYLPPEVQYACLYWVQHLQRSGSHAYDSGEAHRFLQAHLLHWLEALGWMEKVSEGIQAILSLEAYVSINESPNLHAFIHDAKRFALYSRSAIEQAPLQLYCSALVFAPENSIVRKKFKGYIPDWIQLKPKTRAHWNATLQTLEGHASIVRSVAFSPDGKQFVCGFYNGMVRLWDVATGAPLQTLSGHTRDVTSVAFSPDGKKVVSGSGDDTVRLWDAATGALLQTLEGHTCDVTSVAFSPDGKQVVSGSGDDTVRLWDAATGEEKQKLEGHYSSIKKVTFSLDGKTVASASYDNTVRLWDPTTGEERQKFEAGDSNLGTAFAFSPDGKMLASDSGTLSLWDTATGKMKQKFEGYGDAVLAIAFSPDGKTLASTSNDYTVRLWNTTTGKEKQKLKGHLVTAIAISPDGNMLALAFHDEVRLWNIPIGEDRQEFKGYNDLVSTIAFSPDGKIVASALHDNTIQLWDAATGEKRQELKGHYNLVRKVAFSLDGKIVASASNDRTVRLWNTITGEEKQELEGHDDIVSAIAFSPDGKTVASASFDGTVRLWDVVTGKERQKLEGHSCWDPAIVFSPDGKTLASISDDGTTVRLWDVALGEEKQKFKGHLGTVRVIAFSPDGKTVASALDDNTIRLWDAATGKERQKLDGHYDSVKKVVFSLDGKTVASASYDKTVRLWDPTTGIQTRILETGQALSSLSFSADNRYLKTDRGLLSLCLNSTEIPSQRRLLNYAVFFSKDWVIRDGKKVLWLPPDYRPLCIASYNNTFALGYPSGPVKLIQFTFS
ncbi:hypothetical protein RRF57_009801 [Xylaria bambusicola]|uniref:NACHT domain-containing protein n=1 Tax=Xylaria bambusicola TaxID=326684 RepID=A0AAN7Z966_9PEZI